MSVRKLGSILPLLGALFAHTASGATPLKVHEWGTFTSVMGSNGIRMEGVHKEDEPLPTFVYSYENLRAPVPVPIPRPRPNPCPRITKVPCELFDSPEAFPELAEKYPYNPITVGVTQKMETPVIYFYGDEGQKVQVRVDFPQGLISQWFPNAAQFSPAPGQVNTLGPSSFLFDVKLLAANATGLPITPASSIWNPAREVPAANVIEAQGQREKFIFYRGVADFDAHFSVTSQGELLTLNNLSSAPVSGAFALINDGKRGNVVRLGGVEKSLNVQAPTLENGLPMLEYVQKAKGLVFDQLRAEGLTLDESRSLVNTWEKSYFQAPGLRILYIVPRNETERILPLTVTPAPAELVRVLVGRVEVLTQSEEQAALASVQEQVAEGKDLGTFLHARYERFALPKGLRLIQVVKESQALDDGQKQLIERELSEAISRL